MAAPLMDFVIVALTAAIFWHNAVCMTTGSRIDVGGRRQKLEGGQA